MLLDRKAFIYLHDDTLLIGTCSGPGACVQEDWDFEPLRAVFAEVDDEEIGRAVRKMWSHCREIPLKTVDVERQHMDFMKKQNRKELFKNTKSTSVILKNGRISAGAMYQRGLAAFDGTGYRVSVPESATDAELGALVRDVLAHCNARHQESNVRTTTLRCHQYWIKCGTCLKESRFPVYEGDGYLLMRNPENGADCRFVDYRDAVFKEVGDLAQKYKKQLLAELVGNPLHRTIVTNTFNAGQHVFSMMCDSSDGVRYVFDTPAMCPHCRSRVISGWGPTDSPYETIDVRFSEITHTRWQRLSKEQKEKAVGDEVRRMVQSKLDELLQE